MNRIVRHSSIFLKILMIVFAMSSAMSYGACCIDANQEEAAEPCHESQGASKMSHADHGDCCTACLTFIPMMEQLKPGIGSDVEFAVVKPPFITSNIDPPFRPPITYFS